MIPTPSARLRHQIPTALATFGLVLCSLFTVPQTASAQQAETLIPDQAAGFTLEEREVRGPGAVAAIFNAPDGQDGRVRLILAHGEAASQLDSRLQEVWSEREDVTEFEIDGLAFSSFVVDSEVIVYHYADDRLVVSGGDAQADGNVEALKARAVALLEAFELGRLADWTPPAAEAQPEEQRRTVEAPAETAAEAEAETEVGQPMQQCGSDMECFLEGVADCEPVEATAAAGPSMQANHRVNGEAGNGLCRVSFRFTENPNPALVDSPLSYVVDPDDASKATIQEAIEACLQGSDEAEETHKCSGPLVGST